MSEHPEDKPSSRNPYWLWVDAHCWDLTTSGQESESGVVLLPVSSKILEGIHTRQDRFRRIREEDPVLEELAFAVAPGLQKSRYLCFYALEEATVPSMKDNLRTAGLLPRLPMEEVLTTFEQWGTARATEFERLVLRATGAGIGQPDQELLFRTRWQAGLEGGDGIVRTDWLYEWDLQELEDLLSFYSLSAEDQQDRWADLKDQTPFPKEAPLGELMREKRKLGLSAIQEELFRRTHFPESEALLKLPRAEIGLYLTDLLSSAPPDVRDRLRSDVLSNLSQLEDFSMPDDLEAPEG